MQKSDPTPFGRYKLVRRIGAGGMGEVFLATEPEGDGPGERAVVVKKILPHLTEDEGFLGRFQDEGRVVVHLSHVNIAQVFEMGEHDGQLFMAMEYVEGKTLAKVESRLRERNYSFPIDLALWLGAEVCRGLHHAHTQTDADGNALNVVHRDISPSNVMLTYDGAVKIIDFGAALSTLKEEMTAPRVVIGNLSYMSPEHAKKQKVDQRADLFSLGVVLWELISWQQIPSDGDPIERWKRAARPSFQPPSAYRGDLPAGLDDVVMRALAMDVRDRYTDARAMREDLLTMLAAVAPGTDGRRLGAFMRSLFEGERAAERQIVADAVAPEVIADGPTTGRITDPAGTDPGGIPRLSPVTAETRTPSEPSSVAPGTFVGTSPGQPSLETFVGTSPARPNVPEGNTVIGPAPTADATMIGAAPKPGATSIGAPPPRAEPGTFIGTAPDGPPVDEAAATPSALPVAPPDSTFIGTAPGRPHAIGATNEFDLGATVPGRMENIATVSEARPRLKMQEAATVNTAPDAHPLLPTLPRAPRLGLRPVERTPADAGDAHQAAQDNSALMWLGIGAGIGVVVVVLMMLALK